MSKLNSKNAEKETTKIKKIAFYFIKIKFKRDQNIDDSQTQSGFVP